MHNVRRRLEEALMADMLAHIEDANTLVEMEADTPKEEETEPVDKEES